MLGADPLINVTGNAAGCPIDVAMIRSLRSFECMIALPGVLRSLDMGGATLMHRAAVMASYPAIMTLAQAGLGLNDQDHEGMTPLMRSIEVSGNGVFCPEMGPAIARNIRALLALGAHVDEADASKCPNPIAQRDIEDALADPRPLINVVHIPSERLVRHVMETRLDELGLDEINQARAFIQKRVEKQYFGARDVAELFDSFLPALQAKRAMESITKISQSARCNEASRP